MPIDALKEQARRLAAAAQGLEPNAAQRATWQSDVDKVVSEFIDALPTARTYAADFAPALAAFAGRAAQSQSLADLSAAVRDGVREAGILTAGPGHLGYIPGGGLYIGALADHLAAALNPFSADWHAAPVAVSIHNETVRWLCNLVGYGDQAYGDLTAGGSHATLTALLAARRALGIQPGAYQSLCVYAGEHTHHCATKALDVLFAGAARMRVVKSRDHRLDVDDLAALIAADRAAGLKPGIVIATAGSTNLGKVDPLADIAALASEHGLWLHVDAAYGGFFSLCAEARPLFQGLSHADSIVLDPHKGMFLPYGCGAVLVKSGSTLTQDSQASYLQDRGVGNNDQRSPMDFSLELSRPFRSLRLWLALKVHGADAFAAALSEKLVLARIVAAELAAIQGIELVGQPELSITAFRCQSAGGREAANVRTAKLLQRINAHPEVFLSSTTVDGCMVLRVAILSFRTHLATLEQLTHIVQVEMAGLRGEGC